MSLLSNTARKIAFWNYQRTSWQWDVLCVLILVFIFLTPKSWFQTAEMRPRRTVVVWTKVVGAQADRPTIEARAKAQSGEPTSRVTDVRPLKDPAGNVIGYEVDIR